MKAIIFAIFLVLAAGPALHALAWDNPGAVPPRQDTEKEKEKKKEKEIKKQRVFTNEDLKKVKNVNITTFEVDPASRVQVDPNQTAGKKKIDPRQTEKYWRDLKKKIEDNIKKNEATIKKMRSELSATQARFYATSELGEHIKLKNKIDQLFNSIKNYERGLETLKKELEDLEEKARKAGVPPGWLR
jgi:hypothetical protein